MFISDAFAQGAGGPAGSGILGFLPLVILLVVFYFLLIRPQMKQQKDHQKMVDALAKGDEVVTRGGVLGRVSDLGDNFIVLEVADKVSIKVQRHAVAAVLPKGTSKEL